MPPLAVTVAKPVQKRIVDHADFTGQMAAVDGVDIRPRVSGYIDRIALKEGELVKADDLLEVIDPRPYQAALDQAIGQLRQAEAQQKLNEANFARSQDFQARGVIARPDLDTAFAQKIPSEVQVASAQAAVKAARLTLDFTQVKAPMAGRISRQLVTVGNLVQANQVRVALGPLVEGLRVVREGLKPDDEVVVDGTTKVRAGASVTPEPGDMRNYPSVEEAGIAATSVPAGPDGNPPQHGGSRR
jgi:multidrug efflux pump subunit AcrA (membrane-fusion protein)